MGLVAVREGAEYEVVSLGMTVRIERVSHAEKEVDVEEVGGDYENTLDLRTFENRMANDKVVLTKDREEDTG